MKHRTRICILAAALVIGGCSSGNGGGGNGGGGGSNSDVPKEAYDMAKAQVLDLGFKNCGEFWGSVYKKDNPLDFTVPAEYQFKNIQMKVDTFPKTVSEADKLNGIQWQGIVSLSADVTRERPIGGKEWGRWTDGFGAPFTGPTMREVNGKFSLGGIGMALRAACPQ